ncbi:hypothetical protein H8959_017696 [Pygathrix nigripes]
MKSEGMADTDHLNAATQKFTQKSGHNSEELPRGSKNVRAIATPLMQQLCIFPRVSVLILGGRTGGDLGTWSYRELIFNHS